VIKEDQLTKTFKMLLKARGIESLDELLISNLSDFEDQASERVLPNLDKALALLSEMISAKIDVAICADYDVDGIVSAVQFAKLFHNFDLNFSVFFPDRFSEGYGLNKRIVDAVANSSFKGLICLDLGSSEINLLNELESQGIKVLCLDHHVADYIRVFNSAATVVSSYFSLNDSFKVLSTAGISFFVISKLLNKLRSDRVNKKQLLELAAVATVADCVPMKGANKALVKEGLKALSDPSNVGLRFLTRSLNIKTIRTYHLGFLIAPRLNACGRLGEPLVAFRFLFEESKEIVEDLLGKLEKINSARQKLQDMGVSIALDKASNSSRNAFALYDERLNLGVVGLVAQKSAELLGKTVAVAGLGTDKKIKGSCRAFGAVDCFEALSAAKEFFDKYGGHKKAGGFTLKQSKDFLEFKEHWETYFEPLATEKFEPKYDCELIPEDICLQFIRELNLLEPFGAENEPPLFKISGARVLNILKHPKVVKYTLQYGNRIVSALDWKNRVPSRNIILNFTANVNSSSFNGFEEINLSIKDFLH